MSARDAPALAPDRLRPPSRTLPHHRDEPQRPFLGIDGQGHGRESDRTEEGVEEVSCAVSRIILYQNNPAGSMDEH